MRCDGACLPLSPRSYSHNPQFGVVLGWLETLLAYCIVTCSLVIVTPIIPVLVLHSLCYLFGSLLTALGVNLAVEETIVVGGSVGRACLVPSHAFVVNQVFCPLLQSKCSDQRELP